MSGARMWSGPVLTTPSRSVYSPIAPFMTITKIEVADTTISCLVSWRVTPELKTLIRLAAKRSLDLCFTHSSCMYTVRR